MNRRANTTEKGLDFSPSGITVPKENQSGEIINQGAQNFAKGLMQLENKIDTLEASVKFGDFNAKYQLEKAKLQQKYRKNPMEAPPEIRKLGEQLSTEFSKTMRSGPATKFKEMALNHSIQDQDNNVKWAVAQQQDNVKADTQLNYGNVALSAESILTPQGLRDLLTGTADGSLEAVHKVSSDLIDATDNLELKLGTRKKAIDNSMNSRILDNPTLLHGDLQRGLYDDIMTPGEIKQYQKQAVDAKNNSVPRSQYEGFKATSVAISDAVERLQNGDVTPGEISQMIDAYKLHEGEKWPDGTPVIPPDLIKDLESLKLLSYRHMPLPKFERDMEAKVLLADFDTRWDAFQTDRTNRGTVKGAQEEALLYARLVNLVAENKIPPDEFQKKKNIMDTKIASRAGKKLAGKAGMPLKEAFAKAAVTHPIFTFMNDDDLYTAGYTMINAQVNKDKSLTAAEKIKYKDQYFLTYLQEVAKYPPEKLNSAQNPEMIATSILNGDAGNPGLFKKMVIAKHPETGEPLIYGQTTTRNGQTKVFLGLDEKGLPRWGTPKKTLEGFENR